MGKVYLRFNISQDAFALWSSLDWFIECGFNCFSDLKPSAQVWNVHLGISSCPKIFSSWGKLLSHYTHTHTHTHDYKKKNAFVVPNVLRFGSRNFSYFFQSLARSQSRVHNWMRLSRIFRGMCKKLSCPFQKHVAPSQGELAESEELGTTGRCGCRLGRRVETRAVCTELVSFVVYI